MEELINFLLFNNQYNNI